MDKALAVILMLLISAVASAETYKWVDDTGQIHYSDRRPQGVEARRVRDAPPPAEDPAKARQRLDNQIKQLDNERAKDELKQEEAVEQEQEAVQRKQNCETARHNLQILQRGGSRLYQTPDGEYLRLDEEARNERMEESRKAIAEYCDGQ